MVNNVSFDVIKLNESTLFSTTKTGILHKYLEATHLYRVIFETDITVI